MREKTAKGERCLFERFRDGEIPGYRPVTEPEGQEVRLTGRLDDDLVELRRQLDNSSDLIIRRAVVCGIPVALVGYENMFSLQILTQLVIRPLAALTMEEPSGDKLLRWVREEGILGIQQVECCQMGEIHYLSMSGFVLLLIDGVPRGVALGVQGYSSRSVSPPSAETNVRGSREGFVEPIRTNLSMIRRRIKSPTLKFEPFSVGKRSRTDGFLVYMTDSVSPQLLAQVRRRLAGATLDVALDTGYLQPFLEGKPLSFFSTVGVTERPDTLAAKISEGRIGILLDGTPFALTVPCLFSENFQSLDDYSYRPYYAAFIRFLKYAAFLVSMLLPGVYVAVITFHPELLPSSLLFNLAASVESTPFSLVFEALLMQFFYEIMREAGLRMPQPIGHAVSIVGGLVIGDVAVRAGLVSTSMIMVVALTAISSFVVPMLYEPTTVLRLLFIVIGGYTGMFGVTLAFAALMMNLCALSAGELPVTAPASPFSLYAARDLLVRLSWRELGRRRLVVDRLPGSHRDP